jgi:hypothetical protein
MDIKTFALQDWVQMDLLSLKRIDTSDNYSDVMTKATGRVLFYRHMNYILGKIIPSYVKIPTLSQKSTHTQTRNIQKKLEKRNRAESMGG